MAYRKVIRIRAEDSPNVQLGISQKGLGEEPSDAIVVPGVLSYSEYLNRRANWDEFRQCVGLDAEFYRGAELLMYPTEWLTAAIRQADSMNGAPRVAKAMGVDTAEGGDSTCWVVVDELGIIDLISIKTPDTSVIPNRTLALIEQYRLQPLNVMFDQGGGGYEHVCELRRRGKDVQAVAFGEAATPEPSPYLTRLAEKEPQKEVRAVYRNRRAEMYDLVRQRIDPKSGIVFAISAKYTELVRQMSLIPRWYDEEGRIMIPPKRISSSVTNTTSRVTLSEILGRSPDELDALVLAVYGMAPRTKPIKLGAI